MNSKKSKCLWVDGVEFLFESELQKLSVFSGIQIGVDARQFHYYYFFKCQLNSEGQDSHFSKLYYKYP